ncbi:MAG: hypothetical protein KZQ77_03485 [Candidatus Thiodiazotropha sp. (ex Notomyrtea botanica)]|nr:hypothetical protein [Candidatus Thiodiazotropha sp. (ex Notomyrtea botanica)]
MNKAADTQSAIEQEIKEFDQGILDEFKDNYGDEINQFVKNMTAAHGEWSKLDELVKGNDEIGYFSATLFWAFTSLLHSFKFFCYGYQIPAGNLMRQCVEAIAFSIYSTDKSNNAMQKFKEGKISANKAVTKLNKPHVIKKLGLNKDAVKLMIEAQKFYDQFSHPSRMCIASSISFDNPGDIYVGGSYDKGKKEAYDKEFGLRVSLSRDLSIIISNIRSNIEKW